MHRKALDELAHRAEGRGGVLGVVVQSANGEYASVNADRAFTAASLIKLPVMLALLDGVEAGRWSLDDRLPVRDRVGGAGILRDLADVADLSVRDLVTLMIVISDNTAANLLIDRIGAPAVADWCGRHGLRATVLERRMMDAEARARGAENRTSPADMAKLLDGLVRGTLLGPAMTAFALDVLARQQVRDRLPRYLPAGLRIAHKTGELDGLRHDVGIIFTNAPIIVAALTENADEADDLIAESARRAVQSQPLFRSL
ncbi:Beta-lactamase precursor [Actinomadura rubteroloni]|uniref:Beta-lactamase n=1 Tax=Actinomadura rubteroloni TaxID=1926885 RepID=A0A2P4UNU4_9ACTN|nr:serine hydrolase [Actinomadura rubteroloni]POM26699.1 Beta-lactamase precursor [Actinomadura rubteroloni]